MTSSIPTNQEKMQDADRFIGLTISRDPEEIVSGLPIDRIKAMPTVNQSGQLGYYTSLLMASVHEERYGRPPFNSSDFIVRTGIRDASDVVMGRIRKVPHALTLEQALSVTRSPDTIKTIALAAMRPSEGENGLRALWQTHPDIIHLNDEHSAIIADPELLPSVDGCPAAGNANTLTVNPSPLFRRFAQWSGELSVRAFHDRT